MELFDLIQNKNYREIKEILDRPGRVYYITKELVKKIEEYSKTASFPKKKNIVYPSSPYQTFFLSLKNQDYQTAYYYSCICEKITKKNKTEFTIYRYVLEDLLMIIQFNKILNQEGLLDIHQIETLLKKIPVLDDQEIFIHALDLIQLLKQVKKEKLNENDFAQFVYKEKEIFWPAIKKGDYITACEEMKEKRIPFLGKRNQMLYEKLLTLFKVSVMTKNTIKKVF